jgi:CBS domain-containing protein
VFTARSRRVDSRFYVVPHHYRASRHPAIGGPGLTRTVKVAAMTQFDSRGLVIDLMAGDPIVVASDVSVVKVAQILADYDIGGLPVVDTARRLVGVISQTDLVRLWASARPSSDWPAIRVRDVMTTPAVSIRASATLREAARLMTEREVGRLVVIGDDPDTVLGLISDSDLVRGLLSHLPPAPG